MSHLIRIHSTRLVNLCDTLSFYKGAKHEGVDEEQAVAAHKAAYEDNAGSSLSASDMGSAAALKARSLPTRESNIFD